MNAQLLDTLYATFEGSDLLRAYAQRHQVTSAGILTITDDETAALVAAHLAPRVEGKTVVEIGGGLGLLALHLGQYARRVYCIEANPIWATAFLTVLLAQKPPHVSYLFGTAEEFAGQIRGDVALFCSHSGIASLRTAARQFAREVIDVYDEILALDPSRHDGLALYLRANS